MKKQLAGITPVPFTAEKIADPISARTCKPLATTKSKCNALAITPETEKSQSGGPARNPNPNKDVVPRQIAATLAEKLTDDDLDKVVVVYREGLEATTKIWKEARGRHPDGRLIRGHWEFLPDWRTRKACADMIAAYREGLPVQRQQILVGKFRDIEQTRAVVGSSPEALKAISGLRAAGLAVEHDGQVLEGEFEVVQKTVGENPSVASEETQKD